MIYFCRNPNFPYRVTIGTGEWIRAQKDRLASPGIVAFNNDMPTLPGGLEPCMQKWECLGMIDGDEAMAEQIRERLWPATFNVEYRDKYLGAGTDWDPARMEPIARDEVAWRLVDDAFLERLKAIAMPWDWSAVEQLGMKGPGKRR